MKCKTCSHPQRQAIDLALLDGNATLADLSRHYGLSTSSLFRHNKHLEVKMARTRETLQHRLRQDYLFTYNEFLETTRHLVRTAAADGDSRQALQAIGQGTRILNSITRLDVQLDDDTVYRLLASPQWTSQGSLLPTDPRFIADSRQALAQNFFSPCPEIPADAAAANKDSKRTARRPKYKRAKSAKLPKNFTPANNINELFQKDIQCEKILPKNPPGSRQSQPPAAVMTSAAPSANVQNAVPPAQQADSSPDTGNQKRVTVCHPPEAPNSELPFQASVAPPASAHDTASPGGNQCSAMDIEICCFPFETAPANKREKSAKLPKNFTPIDNIIKLYQKHIQSEKILPKNPPGGRQSQAPAAVTASEAPSGKVPGPAPRAQQSVSSPDTGNKRRIPVCHPPEGPNPELRDQNSELHLTPEMRRQLLTPFFPRGDGARPPAKTPPPPPPPKSGKLAKLIGLFRKNNEALQEDNLTPGDCPADPGPAGIHTCYQPREPDPRLNERVKL
jgi:hypothetical protein